MKKFNLHLFAASFFAIALVAGCNNSENTEKASPEGREEYDLIRLQDPATGEIPEGIRMRESAFASTLPKASGNMRSGSQQYRSIGPYNVGGRTRALKIDISDTDVLLAGGVSSGMWRSEDGGASWVKTTSPEDLPSVNCLTQDRRPGKTHIWYYGTGEKRGNSASKSFSAAYKGSGVFKSTDGGKTWNQLESTYAPKNNTNDWSYVFNIAADDTRNDSDIVFAAVENGLMRSNDGGQSWKNCLPAGGLGASWTNIHAASNGIFYAHISSNVSAGGIYRSTDGLQWTKISGGSFPGTHMRTRMATPPGDENTLYVFSNTPGNGQYLSPDENSENERISFLKYTYLSGDGSGIGGNWENRSLNLPQAESHRAQLKTFTGYCMQLAVKPDDPQTIFIGGTNIFRSNDAFQTPFSTSQIGGYDAEGYAHYRYDVHGQHPDQHEIDFLPGNPDIMYVSSDGGVHRTDDCKAGKVIWEDMNNGYVTSQFYSVALAHDIEEPYVTGGLQDNGTWFSNHDMADKDWHKVRGSDGGYAALTYQGNIGYFSTQYANVERTQINPSTGEVTNRKNIMPENVHNYHFIHPWAIDPKDPNRMYLPSGGSLYMNDRLSAVNVKDTWKEIAAGLGDIRAVTATPEKDIVYAGTSSRTLYKIENTTSDSPEVTNITGNISFGGYTSNIAVHPYDPDQLLAVYSNYNVRSIWYSDDGGQTWADVEGNLRGEPDDPNGPPELEHRGDGPSFRWAQFVPQNTGDSTVILVGTSIGLFATNKLDGDNTEWILQASEVIGNAVVEMIDTRLSDGYTVVATHGNGIFSTYFNDIYKHIADQSEYEEQINVRLYPNPLRDQLTLAMSLVESEEVKITVRNMNGQTVARERREFHRGDSRIRMNLSELPAGNYFISVNGNSFSTTKAVIKQ